MSIGDLWVSLVNCGEWIGSVNLVAWKGSGHGSLSASSRAKKEGTFVKAGDAIALVGSTGELSSGPHLHFELWSKGIAVNPQDYIHF